MIPTQTAKKWPQYLAGAVFLLFAIKNPEGAAAAVQTVVSALDRFVDAF